MRLRRVVIALGGAVGGLLGLALVGGAATVVWLSTPSGNRYLASSLAATVSATMAEGAFEIDALDTNLVSRLEVRGLRIIDPLGRPYLEVPEARARYDITSLLTGPLRLHQLDVRGLLLVLDTGPSGRMRLSELFGPASDSTEPFSMPIDLVVDAATLEGTRLWMDESLRIEGGDLRSRLDISGPIFTLTGTELCAHLVTPGPLPVCAEGPIVWDGTFATLTGLAVEAPGSAASITGKAGSELDLLVDAGTLDLAGLDALAGRAGIQGTLGGQVQLTGPTSDLRIDGDLAGVDATTGTLGLHLRVGVGETMTWGGTVDADGVDVAQLYRGAPMPVDLAGRITLDGRGIRYPEDVVLDLAYDGAVDVESTYHLHDVDFTGQLADGVLTLERGAFDGVAGPLDATGTIDLVQGPMRLKVKGKLSAEQITALGVEGLGNDGRADLTITSDLQNGDGRYWIGGRVRYAPFTYTPEVRIDELVADLSGWSRGSDFGFRVSFDGEEALTYGVRTSVLTGRDVDVRRGDGTLTARGPIGLEVVEIPNVGRFESADVGLDARLPDVGPREVVATLQLGAFDLQTFLGTGGTTRVRMVDDAVDFEVDLADGSRPFLGTSGTYDLASAHLHTNRFQVHPTPRLSWTANGPIDLTLVDGGVADSRISLRGSHGDLDLTGDLATSGAVDGRVRAIGLQLDALAELFPESFDGLSGVLRLDTTVMGPAAAPRIDGEVGLEGLWMEDVARWLDVDGTFSGEDQTLSLDLDLGVAGEPLVHVQGDLPVALDLAAPALRPEDTVDLAVSVAAGSLERFEHVTPAELGVPQGQVSGRIDLSGALIDPVFEVTGVVETPMEGWTDPGRVEVDLTRRGTALDGWVGLHEGLIHRADLRVAGTTRMGEVFAASLGDAEAPDTSDLTLWLDDLVATTDLDAMPVSSLLALSGTGLPATGRLVGSVVASGSPVTPRLDAELRWDGGSIGDVPVEVGHLWLRSVTGGLDLQGELTFADGSALVEGRLPFAVDLDEEAATWIEGPMDLHVEAARVPLALASVVDGVRNPRGRLEAKGTLQGTFADPEVDLTAGISDGALVYDPLGLQLTDLTMDAEGRGRRVKLNRFTVRTEPLNRIGVFDENRSSIVRATGAANLDRGALDELSGRVVLDDAWVMGTYDTAMRMAGDVRVSGAWPALNVDGDLALVNGRYVYRSDDAVAASPLQVIDGLAIHRPGNAPPERAEPEPPLYQDFDIDLTVDLKRNLEMVAVTPFFDDLGQLTATITRANVNARLGGEVEVGLNPDASWRAGGEVDVVDGTVQVLRTKFRLDEGTVTLFPDALGESALDLSAVSNVQDTSIDLRITGTIDEPDLVASSEGYDDTQVLVMLLTGRSVEGLTSTQGQAASQDAALAAAALITSSVFSGAASGALSFEADGSVRVGAPWSSSVFSELVLRPFADSDENVVSFALEWALARHLLLEAGAGDRYQWGDVAWETRF